MKKLLFLLFFIPIVSFGQDFLFMGENSFSSTESFRLESNSDMMATFSSDLYIKFAKNDENKYIMVSTKNMGSQGHLIKKRLLIYLPNGKVLSSDAPYIYEDVDSVLTSIYELTSEDIKHIIDNNISAIRYNIVYKYSSDIIRTAKYNPTDLELMYYPSLDMYSLPIIDEKKLPKTVKKFFMIE